jgi:hypothetical protein
LWPPQIPLGWFFVGKIQFCARVEKLWPSGLWVDNIIPYDVVIFADASVKAVAPFQFYRIAPAKEITFTTHAMAPQSVLALCEDISEVVPECYIMEMPGYEWEFNEEMTEKAKNNLFFLKIYSVNNILLNHAISS